MMDPNGQPPPYPGTGPVSPGVGHGFEQYTTQSPASGQTNLSFPGQQVPAYVPPPQFVSQQQTNVVGNTCKIRIINYLLIAQVQGGGGNVNIQPAPVDYTTQAFIACLCCFWPTGLVAIMKATESRDALARGDLELAHQAASTAGQMVRISYVVGIIASVSIVLIIILSSTA